MNIVEVPPPESGGARSSTELEIVFVAEGFPNLGRVRQHSIEIFRSHFWGVQFGDELDNAMGGAMGGDPQRLCY